MRCRRVWVWLVASGLAASPAAAPLQFFGKNKVQYHDQEWRVLETRHFEVHFYAREASMVQDAARLAERAYTQISAVLGHQLPSGFDQPYTMRGPVNAAKARARGALSFWIRTGMGPHSP